MKFSESLSQPDPGYRCASMLQARSAIGILALLLSPLVSLFAGPSPCWAQTMMVKGPNGQMMAVPAGGDPFGGARPGKPSPGDKANSKKADAKPGDGKDEKKTNDTPEPKIIRRGDQKNEEADAEELKATVGEDGRVAFQFRNQPWIDLVQWLAQIADQPLDWQELPGDRVNLRSPGRYTVNETKDLFNRHLLARGYTLLEMPGGITVAKTQGINPAMVPRISVDDLVGLAPNTFVRTSLDLGWLSSEKMAEELKPMISSNGRLTALTTTNRLEAMDAAINLQQIANLLEQERNLSSREALAPEFRLRYIAAEKAKEMLEQFLGVEKKKESPMSPQQMQMMQQMRQQNNGKPQPTAQKSEISIVADTRQNSLYIRAPIDRIAVASEFINRIDVPGQGIQSLADVESRVEVFRLYTLDPEKLIEIIKEMNVMEPETRLRADENNGALIVFGSSADRFIVDKLIKRLDGSGRSFEVLQLRRLEAGEVAESISFLMGKQEDEKKDNNRSRYFYGYGFGGGDDKKKEKDEFRVAANSRIRQVLLWANETEMEQVRNLLIKLGELPPPGGSDRTVRRIDASADPETYQYLLKLQQQWSRLSETPLELPDESGFVDPVKINLEQSDDERGESGKPLMKNLDGTTLDAAENRVPPKASMQSDSMHSATALVTMQQDSEPLDRSDQIEGNVPPNGDSAALPNRADVKSAADFDRMFGEQNKPTTAESPASRPPANASNGKKPPIQIRLDSDGNLILSGSDTKALDQLEDLMLQITPPKRPYRIFKIKHQSSFYVRLNLIEYFEETEEDDDDSDSFFRYWNDISEDEEEEPAGLGKDNELRFVQDPDTNTIVVSGATSTQLRTIAELIELWDVAEPTIKRTMRYTKLVPVEFGRAEKVAETVKEAYRDLLSSNDKTFAAARGGGGGGAPGGGRDPGGKEKSSGRENRGSGLVDSENGANGGDVDFSFKGKLSIGVDDIGNTLLVSAEGEPLLELVEEMIHKLDIAAKPAGDMQIFSVSGNASEESINRVIRAFSSGTKPGTATIPKPNANAPTGQTP